MAIDNNGAERSLRGIAVGRRNWTFYGSDNGGRTAAVLTSLIASCKRLGIDPSPTCAISSNESALIPRADWPNYFRTNGKPPAPQWTERKRHNLHGSANPTLR